MIFFVFLSTSIWLWSLFLLALKTILPAQTFPRAPGCDLSISRNTQSLEHQGSPSTRPPGSARGGKRMLLAKANSQHSVLWWWREFYLGLPVESCVHRGLQGRGDKPRHWSAATKWMRQLCSHSQGIQPEINSACIAISQHMQGILTAAVLKPCLLEEVTENRWFHFLFLRVISVFCATDLIPTKATLAEKH